MIGAALLAALGVACAKAEAETPRSEQVEQTTRVTRVVDSRTLEIIKAVKSDGMSPSKLRTLP